MDIIKVPKRLPLVPEYSGFTGTFRQGLEAGKFMTTACASCGALTFPPKQHCPDCWSDDMNWTELSGQGILYARTTIHAAATQFRDEVPFSVGIVDLEEGVRLVAGLIDDPDRIKNGDAIRLVILSYEDGLLFAARPA
ncbi:MAG: Zn-ribbon domain-containing OB-fold protein [Gammaproteobacteria bacterium]|nr:Zn-ribbon domain-containing OB-fold protein [Gammaproteobacteria bacterium]